MLQSRKTSHAKVVSHVASCLRFYADFGGSTSAQLLGGSLESKGAYPEIASLMSTSSDGRSPAAVKALPDEGNSECFALAVPFIVVGLGSIWSTCSRRRSSCRAHH